MPLSAEEQQLLQQLTAEASKRGLKLPSPVGSPQQLQQAVSQSATIGEMRRREEAGQVSALTPEQIQQATMSESARMGQAMQQEEARLAAAGAPSAFDETAPTTKELAEGGRLAGGIVGQMAGIPYPLAQAGSEALYQASIGAQPREIAGKTAESFVTSVSSPQAQFLKGPVFGAIRRTLFDPAQSILGAAIKTPLQGAFRGGIGEATETLVSGKEWKLDPILKSAAEFSALETGIGGLGNVVGAGARSLKKRFEGGIPGFIGELNRPYYDQFQRNMAEKEGEFVAKLARSFKTDASNIKNVLNDAINKNSTKTGSDLTQSVVSDVEKTLGKLDDTTRVELENISSNYGKTTALSITEYGRVVKDAAQNQYETKNEAFAKEFDKFREDPRVQSKDYEKSVAPGGEIYGPVSGKSLADLWKDQQDAALLIKWNEPVKPGTPDKWMAFNEAKAKFENALSQFEKRNPNDPLVKNFKDLKERYSNFMSVYNTSYSKGILKDVGEEGGSWAKSLERLSGTEGPARLFELKQILGEDFNPIKEQIGKSIFNELSIGGQSKFLDNLELALNGKWGGFQKEVIQEFLPNASLQSVASAKKALEASTQGFSKDFRDALSKKTEIHNADPSVVLDFLNKSKESAPRVRAALSPETLADTQNALLSQIVNDASKLGSVSAESFAKSAENWKTALSAVYGNTAETKIKQITDALQIGAANKTSLISKLIPTIAAVGTFTKTAPFLGNVYSVAGAGAVYGSTKSIQDKLLAYLLENPNYRKVVSKPLEDLTNAETEMLDKDIPAIIRSLVLKP